MSVRKRGGIYFVIGMGLGLILIPNVRKRVLTLMENLHPELYNNFSNLKERLRTAIEAGIEAAGRSENKINKTNNFIKLETDEESPNYII